nr:unnamed protein product [Spirometra erinaceieuropaei]
MLSAMLMDAYRDERPGIRIAYRRNGQLLNHQRIHFQSSVSATIFHQLLFANDCALNATSEGDMQRSMNLFSAACNNLGLVMLSSTHTPPPSTSTTVSSTKPSHSASTINSPTTGTISKTDTNTADFSCPRCPRTSTSHTDLVGHLRIHWSTHTHSPRPPQLPTAPPHSPTAWAY